jgi:hypothetical protein
MNPLVDHVNGGNVHAKTAVLTGQVVLMNTHFGVKARIDLNQPSSTPSVRAESSSGDRRLDIA